MHHFEMPSRPAIEILRAQLEQAERFEQVFSRFDNVCKELGYKGYGDFCSAYKAFYRVIEQPLSANKNRSAGLPGTGKRASPEDLVRGKRLSGEGKSMAEISRQLGLSYQTTLKYAKRQWTTVEPNSDSFTPPASQDTGK
jgi:hypothetical protein